MERFIYLCSMHEALKELEEYIEQLEDTILKLVRENIELSKWKHPEQKEGETLMINIKEGEQWDKPEFVESMRVGNIALDNSGRIVHGYRPLFAILKK